MPCSFCLQKGSDLMANISPEIQAFRDAVKGEEVRGSMISLAQKINTEVETNTTAATQAAGAANTAAGEANTAAGAANTAAGAANTEAANANNAAANAAATRQDILNRLEAGEFKGDKGDTGNQGPQGESGVMAPSSGMFSLYLDPASGNLYAEYPDGETPPAFEYDAVTGNLYFVTDEGGTS